jgi:ABC-type nitrate/sulfonate/bicarbonate transport system permease component
VTSSTVRAIGAPPRFAIRGLRGATVSVIGLVLGALIWQVIGDHTQQSSFVSFTATMSALWHLTTDGELWSALV